MGNTRPDSNVMLRMTDIRKSFSGNEVLKGIDIEVRKGELLAIIGPSGSGKSTLLRCVNMLETIDDGSISIEGEFLADKGVYATGDKARRILGCTGMVFQQFNLFPHMTVMENLLEAPMQVKGMKRKEIQPLAEELLAKVGLSDRADYCPSQ
ncbi:MAG: amino acid ABC transporter ATP-binding protein, partial [Selenomonadaceae bacterium]|nr:amino acid ABC transporter ATP-binding protein [Selenomonadaceae bacterium]